MTTQAVNGNTQEEDLSWMQRLNDERRDVLWGDAFSQNNRAEIERLFRAKVPPFNGPSENRRFNSLIGTLEKAIGYTTTTENDVLRLLELKAVPVQFQEADHRDALNASLTKKEYTDAVAVALIRVGAKVLLPQTNTEEPKWGSLDFGVIGHRNIETLRLLIDAKAQATFRTIELTQGKNYSVEALKLLQAVRIDISEQERSEILGRLDRGPTDLAVQPAAAANPPLVAAQPEALAASSASREEAPQTASRFCACLDGVLPEALVEMFETICGWIASIYSAIVRHFDPVERNSI